MNDRASPTLVHHAALYPKTPENVGNDKFAYTASGGTPNLLVDISYNSSTAPSGDVGVATYTTTGLRSLGMACNNCSCPSSSNPLLWTTCTGCTRFYTAPRARFQFGGACCQTDGSCAVTSQVGCSANWLGAGTTCSPTNPCPQPGACCYSDGSCDFVLQAACTGTWHGDWTTCSPNPCPQPGACCSTDGSCTFVLQSACSGTWHAGTTCTPNPCVGA